MKYKPDEATMAAYLYGELTKEEEAKMEAYLAENPEARKELDEIRSMQQIMGKFENKEVQEPSFVFDQSPVVVMGGSSSTIWLKTTMGIAASIALLILLGYFTELRLEFQNRNASLSFGNETVEQPTETISKEDIKSWMAEAMTENNEQILGKIDQVESSLTDQVALQAKTNKREMNAMLANYKVDQTVIDQYVSQLKDENKEIILSLVEVSEQSQREYMNTMLADFSNYLDQQRANDLEAIQTSFDDLKDHTEINQIETSEILASIISTVNDESELNTQNL